jgi:hypothetical protein
MRAACMALVALALSAAGWAQQAYVGGPSATWRPLPSERRDDAVTVTVPPGDAPAGRTTVVVATPKWMVLDDDSPPELQAAFVGEQRLEVGERLNVASDNTGPRLRVLLTDRANPVDPQSPAILLSGRRIAPEAVEQTDGGLAASFDLSSITVGAYDGALEARDLAPLANVLRIPLRLTVDGILREPDGQTVTITRGGHAYTIGGPRKGQAFVRLGNTGVAPYLTTQVNGKFVYARDVIRIDDIDEGRGVRLTADVIGIDEQDFGQVAALEFNATTRPDFPGLLLTSRARNLDADGTVYCFWGWLPGQGFVTSAGEQPWSMTYRDIGTVGWVFLPPTKPDAPGIGLISALPFGESRFGTLLLYTDPQKIDTARGGAVEMRLAFLLADSAQEVAEAYDVLNAAGWLTGP